MKQKRLNNKKHYIASLALYNLHLISFNFLSFAQQVFSSSIYTSSGCLNHWLNIIYSFYLLSISFSSYCSRMTLIAGHLYVNRVSSFYWMGFDFFFFVDSWCRPYFFIYIINWFTYYGNLYKYQNNSSWITDASFFLRYNLFRTYFLASLMRCDAVFTYLP